MPIHTTRARRKFGKAPIWPIRMGKRRWCAATRSIASLSPGTTASPCSPRNLRVRCILDSSAQLGVGAAARSGSVASATARRSAASKLTARKRRTGENVQRSRAKSSWVELHSREAGLANRTAERRERRRGLPLAYERPIDLDAREIPVMSHAEVVGDSELAKGRL